MTDYKTQNLPDGAVTVRTGTSIVMVVTDPTGSPVDNYITLANLFKPRVVTVTQSATPAINTDNGEVFQISGLAQAITSMTTNLTGTAYSCQEIDIEILDNGTARAITWGASFAAGPNALPTTTILSKWLYVKFRYSSSRSKWICMASGSEQ